MPEINSTIYVVDPTTGDIKEENRKTLGDYLSSKTIKSDEYTTPYGDTVQLRGGGNPGSGVGYGYLPPRPNTFYITSNTSEVNADASTQLPTVPQSRFAYPDAVNRHTQQAYADDENIPLRLLEKLEPSSTRADGQTHPNDLISNRGNESFPGDLSVPDNTRTKIRSSVLMKNRFTEEGRFTSKTHSAASPRVEDQGEGNLFRSHEEPGSGVSRGDRVPQYLRSTFSGATGNQVDGAGSPVSAFKLMRDRGLISVLNASGYRIKSFNDFEGREDTPDSITNRYVFIAGSIVDTATGGKVVDMNEVTPAIDMFTVPVEDPDMGNPETKINNRSYGVLNNYLDKFSGGGSDRAVVVALLLYVSLFVAIAVVSGLFSLIGGISRPDPTKTNLPLGAERGSDFGDIFSGGSFVENLQITLAKLLNINLPYESGVSSIGRYFLNALEGAASLIGLDIDDFAGDAASLSSALGNAVEVVLNLAFASGYYLTLVRAICRDLSLIGQAANEIGSPLGFVDFINKMRDSRIVRITDSCASVGEKNRQRRKSALNTGGMNPSEPTVEDPIEDVDPDRAARRVSRSRVEKGKKTLAWSHSEISSMGIELMSQELLRNAAFSSVNPLLGKVRPKKRLYTPTLSNSRIPDSVREEIELALDSEYMPFYFHDLRTNEILAFHAFLESMSDGFTANYTQSSGFGRMDPVQIYNSTTRSISFSFNVVSTNEEDFDEMWHSINKLVNMCYPQWSEGNLIEDDKNRFIQPFSQVITSSPMLRVRIGDLIHSNYDRFGLSRLFGIGRNDAKINGKGELQKASVAATIAETRTVKDFSITPSDPTTLLPYSEVLKLAPANVTYSTKGADKWWSLNEAEIAALKVTGILPEGPEKSIDHSSTAIIKRGDQGKTIPGTGQYSSRTGELVAYVPNKKTEAPALLLVKVTSTAWTYFSPPNPVYTSSTHQYQLVDPSNLIEKIELTFPDAYGQQVEQFEAEITNFMDPSNNPIVRSFEQASGGRGLAGFITQLGFDWADATWETEKERRAPKFLKVDVQFAPIHDFPMGISHDGTARAVPYPVGNYVRANFFPNLTKKE